MIKAFLIILTILLAADGGLNQFGMTVAIFHAIGLAAHNFQTALSGSIFVQ